MVDKILGHKGDCLILDDPHCNITDKERAECKANAEHWFKEELPKRINKGGPIMIIQSRVHNQDKSGLVFAENVDYEHLKLPLEDQDLLEVIDKFKSKVENSLAIPSALLGKKD